MNLDRITWPEPPPRRWPLRLAAACLLGLALGFLAAAASAGSYLTDELDRQQEYWDRVEQERQDARTERRLWQLEQDARIREQDEVCITCRYEWAR